MTTCAICYDPAPIKECDLLTLDCSKDGKKSHHCFHKKCLLTWSKKGKHCPLCREPMLISHIFNEIKTPTNDYTIKNIMANNILNSKINAWHRKPFNMSEKKIIALPLYKISDYKDYITFYLRLCLIYKNGKIDNSKVFIEEDISKTKYLDTSLSICGNIDKNVIFDSYYKFYSMMFNLKKMYEFDYTSAMNTLIYDLTILTLNEKNITDKRYFNQILELSIYNVINVLSDVKLYLHEVQGIIEIEDYHPTIVQENFIKFQKNYLDEYLTVN